MKTFASNLITGVAAIVTVLVIPGASCEPPAPEPAPAPDEPIRPDPEPVVDPSVGPVSPCAQVCANMERLKCLGWDGSPGPDGKMGTDDDMACTPACQEYIRQDPTADGYQHCQAAAQTCEAMDACYDE